MIKSPTADEGRHVDVVFLVFAKAFDRRTHCILSQKLCNDAHLNSVGKDDLNDREQRVLIEKRKLLDPLIERVYFKAPYNVYISLASRFPRFRSVECKRKRQEARLWLLGNVDLRFKKLFTANVNK